MSRELIKKGVTPEKQTLTLFCQVCESYVHERTKHCGSCNRCVELFDHHCKWLNNCIGAKNYKTFLILIILVGVQSFYYTITGLMYIIIGLSRLKTTKSRPGFCLIDSDKNRGISIFMSLLILAMIIISSVIFIGICLLLKLHIKLLRFDFTTFEYIQYLEDRKDRVYKLKNKKITKEKFDELEMKARSKINVKRSKIIKEVNEANEHEILQKILKKKQQFQGNKEQEESKFNSQTNSMIKVSSRLPNFPLAISRQTSKF